MYYLLRIVKSIFKNKIEILKFSSKILEDAVNAVSSLPGIGKKTALRMVLHLVDDFTDKNTKIRESLLALDTQLKTCTECYSYSDEDLCEICGNVARKKNLVCVVESIRDVMAIEDTQQFSGVYHVLGGVISPLEGIGPEKLNIDSLVHRVKREEVEELIMAISPTIEGETTIFYISKMLEEFKVRISTIARGVSFGGELEFADEYTLAQSILSRMPYKQS